MSELDEGSKKPSEMVAEIVRVRTDLVAWLQIQAAGADKAAADLKLPGHMKVGPVIRDVAEWVEDWFDEFLVREHGYSRPDPRPSDRMEEMRTEAANLLAAAEAMGRVTAEQAEVLRQLLDSSGLTELDAVDEGNLHAHKGLR